MYTYDKVAKNIGPKKEALAQAEGELAVVQSELGKKQEALRKVGAPWRANRGSLVVTFGASRVSPQPLGGARFACGCACGESPLFQWAVELCCQSLGYKGAQ